MNAWKDCYDPTCQTLVFPSCLPVRSVCQEEEEGDSTLHQSNVLHLVASCYWNGTKKIVKMSQTGSIRLLPRLKLGGFLSPWTFSGSKFCLWSKAKTEYYYYFFFHQRLCLCVCLFEYCEHILRDILLKVWYLLELTLLSVSTITHKSLDRF